MGITGFQRSVGGVSGVPALDESQAAVVALADDATAAVFGAPGSGKTTTLIELVRDRVLERGWAPDELVVLTPSRASATGLRDRIAARLDVPTPGPLARTVNSLAFEIVRDAATIAGEPQPTLLTGAEQDQIIADLIEGEIAEGIGAPWPEHLDAEVRRLRGFRTELRDLMMRCVERGVTAAALGRLGVERGRPEWVAASAFIAVYDEVKASYRGRHFDSAELVQEAAALVREGALGRVDRLRLVVLDDAQESTESTLALVRALAGRGVAVIAFGDPDVTTGGFRGAEPGALAQLGQRLGVAALPPLVLSRIHRHDAGLRTIVSRVTDRVGVKGAVEHRRATAAADTVAAVTGAAAEGAELEGAATAVAFELASPMDEIALIARRLRERHLFDGVPWSQMAVIVRTGSLVPALARSLQVLEVQTTVSSARTVLREEYAVRGLVLLLQLALGRRELDPECALDLLLGAIGRLDSVAIRRLKAALRHEELAGGGDRGGDELVAEALRHPAGLATIDTRVARAALRVAENLRATAAEAAEGATIEELLWGAWQRSGLESVWFEQSLGSGVVAEEANRHLDAVVALFSAAKRFVERTPDFGPGQFLDAWVSAELEEDTLAPRSALDSVTIGTPSAMLGREFDTVVIAGLQENVWPNPRLRGSLLGALDLAAVLAGEPTDTVDRRAEVIADELRMFAQAVSRATSRLILTAVAGEDSQPSPFHAFAARSEPAEADRYPLSLRGLVGRLRRELTSTGSAAAASGLARLALEGVPGADPSSWYGLAAPSTTAPLVDLDDPESTVRISPSRMQSFESCALHWLIDEVAGSTSSTASSLGTIIHAIAETTTDTSTEAIFASIEERWGELSFEAPWQSEVEKVRARELAGRLSAYLTDFERSGGTLLSAELSFELAVGQARLRGSIDRVERLGDGTAVIVDLKTGKLEPTTDAAVADHPQLGAYQLAFASGVIEGLPEGIPSGGAKLVVVSEVARSKPYVQPRQPAFTAEQLEEFRARVEADAAGMAGAVFVAQLGSHCLDPWSFGRCSIHVVRAVSA